MIAVVGGTGRLGAALVPILHAAGASVRVVSRSGVLPPALGPLVPDVVRADVRDAGTLDAAVRGAEVVVSAVHGLAPGDRHSSPAGVDVAGNRNLVEAAVRGGAAVVLVSVVGAAPDGSELQRAKWAAEENLRASGAPWTVVRSTAFLEQWQDVLRATAARDGRPVVLGRGRNPVTMVPVAEVAPVVADACLDPATRGRVLEVLGGRDHTLDDLAATLCAPGVHPRHVPRPLLRVAGQALRPLRPDLARLARMSVWMDTAPLARTPASARP